MEKESKDWMGKLHLKKGALRKTLGVKKGKKIPTGELNEVIDDPDTSPLTKKRAVLARTFKKSFKK